MYNAGHMGFIEEERKRHEAELAPKQSKDKFDVMMCRGMSQYGDRYRNFAEGYKDKLKKAYRQFQESGLDKMLSDLYHCGSYAERRGDFDYEEDPKYVCRVSISEHRDYPMKYFIFKVSAGGIIEFNFDKDLSGHSVLTKDQWQGKDGRERVGQALGKAFANPNLIKDPDYGHKYGISDGRGGGYSPPVGDTHSGN